MIPASVSKATTWTSERETDDGLVDSLLLIPRRSSSSSSSAAGDRGAETLEARREKEIEKDLLVIIDEGTEIELDAASVTTDVRSAAKMTIKKKEDTMRGVLCKIRSAQQVHLAFLVDFLRPAVWRHTSTACGSRSRTFAPSSRPLQAASKNARAALTATEAAYRSRLWATRTSATVRTTSKCCRSPRTSRHSRRLSGASWPLAAATALKA